MSNSAFVVSIIISKTILVNELIVSFDLESTLLCWQLWKNGRSLAERRCIPAQIAVLLTFLSRSNYFQANGAIDEKLKGTAMRSTISAVTGNIEEQAKTTSY